MIFIAYDPRDTDEVFQSLKTRLTNKIPELTNFIETSFNYVFTRAFASEQHNVEVALTAAQLSAWVEYSGKTLTEEDLNDLNIDGATAIELNEYMEPEHLEQLAKGFGVTRDLGSRAIGDLEITTSQATSFPAGRQFGTQPDATGDFIRFETTENFSVDSATTGTVEIQAINRGTEANVSANTITYMPNPPIGVLSVTNPNPTTAGTDEQSIGSLRNDVQQAVVESAEGGTVAGLESFIENNTDAISVIVQENFEGDTQHGSYPHADVVVFGGTDANVQDAIDFAHPSGVEHILTRPDVINVDVSVNINGSNIDTGIVTDRINTVFTELNLSDNFFQDKLIQEIMNADSNVDRIESINTRIVNEEHSFTAGTSVYELDKQIEFSNSTSDTSGITEVTGVLNGSSNSFIEGTDYQEYNSVASSTADPHDSINWGLNGDSPDDGTVFNVDYIVQDDILVSQTEVLQLQNVTVSVV